jgi:hypothetical protein
MRRISDSDLFDYLASSENGELLDRAIERSDTHLAELKDTLIAYVRDTLPESVKGFPEIPPREAYNYAKPLVDEYLGLPSESVQPEFLEATLANAVKLRLDKALLLNGILPVVTNISFAYNVAAGIRGLANLAGLPEDISGAYAVGVGALVGTMVAWGPNVEYLKHRMKTPGCITLLTEPKKIQIFGVDAGSNNVATQLEEYSHAVYSTFFRRKHNDDLCVDEGFAGSVSREICRERGDLFGRLAFECTRKDGLTNAKELGGRYKKTHDPHDAGAAYFALLEEAEIAKGRPLREFYRAFVREGAE